MLDFTGVPELPQVDPVAELLKQIEANRPEYPAVIVENLGGIREGQGVTATSKDDLYRRPKFSGWNGTVDGISEWELESFKTTPNNPSDISYYAFWKMRASKDTVFWVSLPSMRSGESKWGDTADIGMERVHAGDHTQDNLDEMVKQGYEIIQKMIAERGEYKEND